MHVELVDLFRCLTPHEDSWLVAAANETIDRVIVNGVLGCPVCGAEYPIVDGVVQFALAPDVQDRVDDPGSNAAPDETEVFRLAAQLDLSAPGKTIALVGYGASIVRALLALVPTRVVLVNAPHESFTAESEPIARITCGRALPIASASLHGIALRASELPTNTVDILRPGGRIVAQAHLEIPSGTSEIARDHREWVVARDAVASPPVRLSRRHVSE